MTKLRVHNLLVTLDGYATGAGQTTEAAFGDAQQELLDWFVRVRLWRGLLPDGNFGPDEAIEGRVGVRHRRRDHGTQQVPPHPRAVA